VVAEAEAGVDRELEATEDELREAALAEIIALTTLPPRRSDEITVKDYVKGIRENGGQIGENAARNRLDRAVTAGALESRFAMDEGRRKKVYRKRSENGKRK
jgi:hypothetical protein